MAHTAQVWLIDCRDIEDAALAHYSEWLGPCETLRLARFVRRERRRQFLVGRVVLRQALGQVLGVPARTLKLLERPGCAPLLDLPGQTLPGFSLSHSGPWVACALSSSTAIGLDIELLDAARDIDALAAQALEPQQQAWLAGRAASTRVRDFYELWSGQEARYKLNEPAVFETTIYHPELSLALCSAQRLASDPQLVPMLALDSIPESR